MLLEGLDYRFFYSTGDIAFYDTTHRHVNQCFKERLLRAVYNLIEQCRRSRNR